MPRIKFSVKIYTQVVLEKEVIKIMKNRKVDIMGTQYECRFGSRKELSLSDGYDGECKLYDKYINIATDSTTLNRELNDKELEVRILETLIHEFFHAYLSETGVRIDDDVEEFLACFLGKNWYKMNRSIADCYSFWKCHRGESNG